MARKLTVLTALVAAVAVVATAVPAGAVAPAGNTALREFEGTVVSRIRHTLVPASRRGPHGPRPRDPQHAL